MHPRLAVGVLMTQCTAAADRNVHMRHVPHVHEQQSHERIQAGWRSMKAHAEIDKSVPPVQSLEVAKFTFFT